MTILLNKPVTPCLKTLSSYLEQINERGSYTNFGPLHQELTSKLEEYLGVKNLLLVSNGTLALHIAYRVLDIKSAACTPFSYAATASSLAWEKIPFLFSDIDSDSLNMCPKLVEEKLLNKKNIDSIVATHVYGNACDVEAFEKLQRKFDIKIIYDGAHAFNIKYGKKSLASYGDASTLSFHATKVFHTLEGGAIIFKKKENFNKAKQSINFGIDSNGSLNQLGINAKLNEYQCAVGLTLFEIIDDILGHRVNLFNLYKKLLESYIQIPIWNNSSSVNGAYFPIILQSNHERQHVKLALENSNIPSREYFSPSLDSVYNKKDVCINSRDIASRVLCLPLHYHMSLADVKTVSQVVKSSITNKA